MMRNGQPLQTDLACENTAGHHTERIVGEFTVIKSEHADGIAYTLKIGELSLDRREKSRRASVALSALIVSMLPSDLISSNSPVSVLCLGNGAFTADSLGSLCAPNIVATRHLKSENPKIFSTLGGREISVICAGVTANTGINPFELAKMCVDGLGSRMIIVIVSLKASAREHLCRTVQITDRITAGAGVGNDRPEISKKALKVPVIAIGVPTAISSKALFSQSGQEHQKALESSPVTENITKNNSTDVPLLVSPIDCDASIKSLSTVIAQAVNLTLIGTFFE